jgi:glucokinase
VSTRYVVAVDVGGTEIKIAVVDSQFNVLALTSTPTPKGDKTAAETIRIIAAQVNEFTKVHAIEAIGLVVPGVVDESAGIARWTGNLQWENVRIQELLHEAINIPVAFGHDVRTAALAELRSGAVQGIKDAIFIPIGTGIAAALIINGEIQSAQGNAGEIGHLNVDGKRLCVCGKTGCLEAVSSALAISSAYVEQGGAANTSTEKIYELVTSGDPLATDIWKSATDSMSRACEILITVLAPEVIVFGGGLSNAGETLLAPIRKHLDSALTFQRKPHLKIAEHGSKAGIIGCAMIAFDLIA